MLENLYFYQYFFDTLVNIRIQQQRLNESQKCDFLHLELNFDQSFQFLELGNFLLHWLEGEPLCLLEHGEQVSWMQTEKNGNICIINDLGVCIQMENLQQGILLGIYEYSI